VDRLGRPATTDIEYQEIEADVYLSNNSQQDIIVRTRDLLAEVQLDCIAVAEDPGLLLSESLFGAGRTWTMPPSTNAAARDIDNTADPRVLRRARRGRRPERALRPVLAAADIAVTTVVGDIDDPSQHTNGAVILAADPTAASASRSRRRTSCSRST
jgi:hypothetical protein